MVIGFPAAFAAGRLIRSQLYEVSPYDPFALTAAAILLIAIGPWSPPGSRPDVRLRSIPWRRCGMNKNAGIRTQESGISRMGFSPCGELDTYHELLSTHEGVTRSCCMQFKLDQERTEDIVQDTLVIAIKLAFRQQTHSPGFTLVVLLIASS